MKICRSVSFSGIRTPFSPMSATMTPCGRLSSSNVTGSLLPLRSLCSAADGNRRVVQVQRDRKVGHGGADGEAVDVPLAAEPAGVGDADEVCAICGRGEQDP